MATARTIETELRRDWKKHRAEVDKDLEAGWEEEYRPGTHGCHELLDRASLIGDLVEAQILGHPSCALNEEWYRLASRAAEALRELYQQVGAEHMADE